jgi:hypothetical protein
VPVVVFVFFCGRGRFQNAFSNGLFGMLLHRQLREREGERERIPTCNFLRLLIW